MSTKADHARALVAAVNDEQEQRGRVIPAPDLRAEVIARMESLGRGRSLSPSVIADHGERRSLAAVWRTLEELWERGLVEWPGESTYRLPAPREVGQATHDQLTMGET